MNLAKPRTLCKLEFQNGGALPRRRYGVLKEPSMTNILKLRSLFLAVLVGSFPTVNAVAAADLLSGAGAEAAFFPPQDNARDRIFNDGWLFHRGDVAGVEREDFKDADWRGVRLPHDWSVEPIPSAELAAIDMISPVSGTWQYIDGDNDDYAKENADLAQMQGHQPVSVTVAGDGTLAACGTGDHKDVSSFRNPEGMKTWRGRAMVIIRPNEKAGVITVTARSATLGQAELRLVVKNPGEYIC